MKQQKRFKTSLIALTQRYRPPALERIYIGADGLLNAVSKIFRMFVLKISSILRQGQAKHTIHKDDIAFIIGTLKNMSKSTFLSLN